MFVDNKNVCSIFSIMLTNEVRLTCLNSEKQGMEQKKIKMKFILRNRKEVHKGSVRSQTRAGNVDEVLAERRT